jgi:hypothetical protein
MGTMNKKQRVLLIREYESGGIGYRTLAKKYGTSLSSVARMIVGSKTNHLKGVVVQPEIEEDNLPDDIKILKQEIRKLKLKVELQDIIIDISSKELGVDLRKKRGSRQSR